ncbi:hypothetical protein M011DRAFT_468209 [Sporormia fimetaria CBS 119925]|uniref:Condensin complex subunit 1 n=1 Tax=Sporormia fimetaria CBS 119925 TaxID=1340428 RepID=A0A6A6VCT3_9PLEO|nr:hypothetical protein M011DRAFT_468209 [Sporormia fimetaria CBS 119925]
MDARVDFDVNDALKHYSIDPASIETPEAPSELVECENDPEALTPALINSVLNPVIDAVAESPDAITRSSVFDTLQFLLKISAQIPAVSLTKVLDLLTSAISAEAELAHADVEADERELMPHHKQLLEMYAFLLQWAVSAVETRSLEKPATTAAKGRGKGAKKTLSKDDSWDSSEQLEKAFDVMSKVLAVRLSRVFMTTADRETFVSLFTKPVYHVLENEARVKKTSTRNHCFKVLCMAVKHHGHAFGAQTAINQNLTYFEHLSEPMAEFLQILAEQYDYPQLTEDVLKELGQKEFNPNDTKGPKSVSIFLTKISEHTPQLVINQISILSNLLENESYTLRCAMIEICGNLIIMLTKQNEVEPNEQRAHQIKIYFDVLEERFRDINPYCRCRVMQVYHKICDLDTKYAKHRLAAAQLAAQSLRDKSSHARRNAIKLLIRLVDTHPFRVMHEAKLSSKVWLKSLEDVETQMDALKPPEELQEHAPADQTVDASLLQDATQVEQTQAEPKHPSEMTEEEKFAFLKKKEEEAATLQLMGQLHNTRKYLRQALNFIEVIEESVEAVTLLLSSKNKSEVIEAMDFFKMIDNYEVQNARTGIRKMLRLIWTKGNSDEGKGIQTHLIECYKTLFFIAPPGYDANATANYIANNMISLTFGTTPAELTSLEQLLSTMMKQGFVKELVIEKLWQVYGFQKRAISKKQRRGAIIVLGMLALADSSIITNQLDACLRIGLGELGRQDLGLARYTCLALRRISPPAGKQSAGVATQAAAKMPNDYPALLRLAAMIELPSDHIEWFGVAEQAISAIYDLSRHPDVLCSEIIRRKTKQVFAHQPQQRPTSSGSTTSKDTAQVDHSGDTIMEDVEMQDAPAQPEQEEAAPEPSQPSRRQNPAMALSQLLYIVGHVAIKQIVHLELCEQEFKRRKAEKEKKSAPRQSTVPPPDDSTISTTKRARGRKKKDATPAPAAPEGPDELDLMAGTTEDDFSDHMNLIRERELLYGPNSLLTTFGRLVQEICRNGLNNTSYNHPTLQAQAALCLAKFMCVSSEYCATNLPLLLTILGSSKDPIIRSNLVIALGDMAVCFNHLIDEQTDFLYQRLSDSDASVKRTCLMTLTFLILAGQVKVKGQLGEMAKCLEDQDRRIVDMSRTFFTELATKDNAVYNQFLDIFSVLSAEGMEEEGFKRIVRFLCGFVEKDKHSKALANKLASRLPRAETQRQWNDIAFTVGLLQPKDEGLQETLAGGFKVVQANA